MAAWLQDQENFFAASQSPFAFISVCQILSTLVLAQFSFRQTKIWNIDYKKMVIYYSPQVSWEVHMMTYSMITFKSRDDLWIWQNFFVFFVYVFLTRL